MKKIFLCLMILLTGAASAHAVDRIFLKTGGVVEGEIFSQTKYSVKMKVNGIPKVYYTDQIERVESGIKEDAAGQAEDKPMQAGSEEDLTAEKRELILKFLEASGMHTTVRSAMRAGLAKVSLQERQRLEKVLDEEKILENLVPIYAKYFTMEDLGELIRFYMSPVGKRYLDVSGNVMNESLKVLMEYFGREVGSAAD